MNNIQKKDVFTKFIENTVPLLILKNKMMMYSCLSLTQKSQTKFKSSVEKAVYT